MSKYSIGDIIKHKGGVIRLVEDDTPTSPREWDNLGTILYTSTRYTLGDKRVDAEEIREIVRDPNNIVLPVYAYIHSGTRLSTSPFHCPWDSGQCGIIYCTKEKARKEGVAIEQVRSVLNGEIIDFDHYISGNVAGWIAEFEGEEIDSCWGYYPDEDGYFTQPVEEGKSILEAARKQKAKCLRTKRQQRNEYLAFL